MNNNLIKLRTFLARPGINVDGICREAAITKQGLYKSMRNDKLPGKKVWDKLLPVLKSYGY